MIAMDTDKIKVFGARVRVDATGKLAELERAEKVPFPICKTYFAHSPSTNSVTGQNEAKSGKDQGPWNQLLC
jgi:hypothetical protein